MCIKGISGCKVYNITSHSQMYISVEQLRHCVLSSIYDLSSNFNNNIMTTVCVFELCNRLQGVISTKLTYVR